MPGQASQCPQQAAVPRVRADVRSSFLAADRIEEQQAPIGLRDHDHLAIRQPSDTNAVHPGPDPQDRADRPVLSEVQDRDVAT